MSSKQENSGTIRRHEKQKPPNNGIHSNCKLPLHLMVSILTRLPSRSLIRFKSVCKSFKILISRPKFINLHFLQMASNPNNDYLIIQSITHHMYLLNVNNATVIDLIHPIHMLFSQMNLVGSTCGILCFSCLTILPIRQIIVPWNPAIKNFEIVNLPKYHLGKGQHENVFLLLGFDDANSEFKVVRMVFMPARGIKPKDFMFPVVEVYSSTKESWKSKRLDFMFYVRSVTRANVIVKGNPIWIAFVIDPNDENNMINVLIKFDAKTERFKQLPLLPNFTMENGCVVEYKDSLACIVVLSAEYSSTIVELWMYDEGDLSWGKKFTLGPIGLKVERPLQCSKSGDILVEGHNGKIFLFDCIDHSIREIFIQGDRNLSYETFAYTESMVRLRGVNPVKTPEDALFRFAINPTKFNIMDLLMKTTNEIGSSLDDEEHDEFLL